MESTENPFLGKIIVQTAKACPYQPLEIKFMDGYKRRLDKDYDGRQSSSRAAGQHWRWRA